MVDKREMEGERKLHPTRQRPGAGGRGVAVIAPPPEPRPPREVTLTEGITIRELAEKLDIRAKDLLKTLLDRGVFASINQALDVQTATELAQSFNGVVSVVSFEEEMVLEVAKEETKENLKPRPPVVTVMGHVDHGKTSLLDGIRAAEVAAGEAGGITQHIGAYKVQVGERSVVFVDTPGHEAFTRMRARGAKVTDIVVLVVAADDGVMPQTREAIDHARAASVPIIVAVNKIDKPEAQPERVKRQLSDLGLMPAEWGGDTEFVEVSAKQKTNLDKLLEIILLVADLRELKANPDAPASGTVLESRVDKGRGPVATILVQNGTLNTSDFFIAGSVFGKVRAMFDDRGRPAKDAPPSTPIEVLGLQGVPEAGDHFQVTDEAKARHVVEFRQSKQRDAALRASAGRAHYAGPVARAIEGRRGEGTPAGDQGGRAGLRGSFGRDAAETFDRPGETEDHQRWSRRGDGKRCAAGQRVRRDYHRVSVCGRIARRRTWRNRKTWISERTTLSTRFPTKLRRPWKGCWSRWSRRPIWAARKCGTRSA